jgi:hypothetical protein
MSQLPAKPSEDELRIETQIKELLEKVNIFLREYSLCHAWPRNH